MKSAKLLVALAATGLVATSAFAQKSAFEGFYGQIATGYESNSLTGLNGSQTDTPATPGEPAVTFSAPNQTFGTAPLVVGLGYTFSLASQWTLGLGVDYSTLSQTSSSYSSVLRGGDANGASLNGSTVKISNRYNIFVTPGYAIDKDKLVYLKAGYSSVQLQGNGPTSISGGGESAPISGFSSPTATVSGYVVGLGYKQIITGGLYGFAEGNYMSYGRANLSSSKAWSDGTGRSNFNSNPSLNSYQLLVGVGYKF
jgi:outer membrane immunogenic protein